MYRNVMETLVEAKADRLWKNIQAALVRNTAKM